MSTVAEIIDAVKQLDADQRDEFLDQLAELDFEDAWDQQIEADARSGRLDHLWAAARADITAGRVRPLGDVLNDN